MRSSVSFGRDKTDYTSSSKGIFVPVDKKTFIGARVKQEVAKLQETHFVLGDNNTAYTTTNSMRAQNGRRGDAKSGIQYGDLLVSNLSLGQEKVNYKSCVAEKYQTFGADDMAVPSRDIAIKLMAGSQLKLGDDMPDYVSESKGKFIPESSLMEVLRVNKQGNGCETVETDPLAQNGRAQPLSSVLMGRYNEKWSSGSISAGANPTHHKDYTKYEGRQAALVNAYKSNMVLGDETLDYKSCTAKAYSNLRPELSIPMHKNKK